MREVCVLVQLIALVTVIEHSNCISSPLLPFTKYKHSTELEANTADLWWTVDADEREIMFELHIKTTGWIALGISPGRFLFCIHSRSASNRLSAFSRGYERCRYWSGLDRSDGQHAFSSNRTMSLLY